MQTEWVKDDDYRITLNFAVRIIGYQHITTAHQYNNTTLELYTKLTIVLRNGYYEGANLDYTKETDESIELEYCTSKTARNKIEKSHNNKLQKAKIAIEKLFQELSEYELSLVGTYSNGGGVYEYVRQ
jgi:hypothetical protein